MAWCHSDAFQHIYYNGKNINNMKPEKVDCILGNDNKFIKLTKESLNKNKSQIDNI